MWNNFPVVIPNGVSTSNLCRFDVDITSIRWRPSFDGFPRHFHIFFRCNFADRKTHVVSTYYFRCNFDVQKILVASTYFFWCNFDGQKIHVVSTYFFRGNFDGRKIHFVCYYFFRRNFNGQKFDFVFGKLWANENIREGFPLLVTLKSWPLRDCSL